MLLLLLALALFVVGGCGGGGDVVLLLPLPVGFLFAGIVGLFIVLSCFFLLLLFEGFEVPEGGVF